MPLTYSIIIPTYNMSVSLPRTLNSILHPKTAIPEDWKVEIIVVDDGSNDQAELIEALKRFPDVVFDKNPVNQGKWFACNRGLKKSSGEFVTIFDADDELAPDWPEVFAKILEEWPAEANVCYSACVNENNRSTVNEPEYRGYLAPEDMMNGRHSGEYLPFFRGDYIRRHSYQYTRMKKDGVGYTYLSMILDAPFWITPRIIRIYNDDPLDQLVQDITQPHRAKEYSDYYQVIRDEFGEDYRKLAPVAHCKLLLKHSAYLKFAGRIKEAWQTWLQGAHGSCLKDTLGALLILLLPRSLAKTLIVAGKRFGLIQRYG